MDQFTLDGQIIRTEEIPPPPSTQKYKKPYEMHGPGPEGETCRTCGNYMHISYRGRKYNKCPEWILSHSEATDLRLKWPACGRWKERKK